MLEISKVAVVPISVVLLGYIVNGALQDRQLDAQYIGIAATILGEELPANDASEEQVEARLALREWAVDILVSETPVELEDDAIQALRDGTALRPGSLPPKPIGWLADIYCDSEFQDTWAFGDEEPSEGLAVQLAAEGGYLCSGLDVRIRRGPVE